MGNPNVLPDLMKTMNSASTECVGISLFRVAMANVYMKIYNVITIMTVLINLMNITVMEVKNIINIAIKHRLTFKNNVHPFAYYS
jgi:hypothetical protein